MDGVLNKTTDTVHKGGSGAWDLETMCGVAHTAPTDYLRPVPIGVAVRTAATTKCGRCFGDKDIRSH